MGELWRLLMTLEPAAASLTAESAAEGAIDGAQIAALEDNLARTRDAVERGSGVAELDKEFHGIIAKATGNRALMLAREPAVGLLFPAVETLMPRLPQAGLRLIAAHTRILEALKAGNAPEAETWMRKHIADFKRGYDLLQLDLDAPVRPDGAL